MIEDDCWRRRDKGSKLKGIKITGVTFEKGRARREPKKAILQEMTPSGNKLERAPKVYPIDTLYSSTSDHLHYRGKFVKFGCCFNPLTLEFLLGELRHLFPRIFYERWSLWPYISLRWPWLWTGWSREPWLPCKRIILIERPSPPDFFSAE